MIAVTLRCKNKRITEIPAVLGPLMLAIEILDQKTRAVLVHGSIAKRQTTANKGLTPVLVESALNVQTRYNGPPFVLLRLPLRADTLIH